MDWNGISVRDAIPTGSRVICDPPVLDTDEDWVLLDNEEATTDDQLLENDFLPPSSGLVDKYGRPMADEPGLFKTYRKGILNVILVFSPKEFQRWKAATHAAKCLNVKGKNNRIILFQAVLYGNCWTPPA